MYVWYSFLPSASNPRLRRLNLSSRAVVPKLVHLVTQFNIATLGVLILSQNGVNIDVYGYIKTLDIFYFIFLLSLNIIITSEKLLYYP